MNLEKEVKFLNIDKQNIRILLKEKGFICEKEEFLMKRKTFHNNNSTKNEWYRVRNEGDKITMTYKCIHKNSLEGIEEIETIVSDFEATSNILIKTGLFNTSKQENYREVWKKEDIEICIDTWPGLNPYIEIESDNTEKLEKCIKELGFDIEKGLFGGSEIVYETELGIPQEKLIKLPKITFNNIPTNE